jgi:hypothetical protein
MRDCRKSPERPPQHGSMNESKKAFVKGHKVAAWKTNQNADTTDRHGSGECSPVVIPVLL